ncbi:MAG: TRAP transporter large permease subunit [Thermodesulfobacteriota bacterium]
MTTLLLSAALILLALFGTPLFAIILAVASLGFYHSGIELTVIASEIYRLADTPMLSALPLFTAAGYILAESQAANRLVRLADSILGWLPGGLAVVAFAACALFTAFTGASGVTIVALGALLMPALIKAGYNEKFSLGLVTTSGSLGLLLPPSLPLILYGIVAQQMASGADISIDKLFIAGIAPGLLMVVLLSLWSVSASPARARTRQPFSAARALEACRAAIWEIPLPFFLMIGIYSGYFAISEAAAIVALYVLLVEVFIYREISLSQLPAILREAVVMVGGILLILAASLALTNYLIDADVPTRLFTTIQAHISSRLTFLIILNIILLALGAILDIFSAIVIMVPLLLPIADSYGIDPIHLGIIFLANMQIGYLTPPVGMNLFIASYRFHKPITTVYLATLPFMLILLAALLIITYVPQLSLFLVR